MYRMIALLLVYVGEAAAAPQDSDVTFVKIQPLLSVAENAHQNSTSRESRVEKLPLVIRGNAVSEDEPSGRDTTRDEVTTELDEPETTTGLAEITTEREEYITSPKTSTVRTFTKPSPGLRSKPRFYNKAKYFSGVSNNLVEKPEKNIGRRYKSRCRCEKIWNCPKLQITVPRCPDEYFLCCF